MTKILKWEDIVRLDIEQVINDSTRRVQDIIDNIATDIDNGKSVKLIFVCGPSASGKTSFANMLEEKLDGIGHESHTLSLDDFFINRADLPFIKDDLRDYDSVNALDIDAINRCFNDLIDNNRAFVPEFDFFKGERRAELKLIEMDESDVVIVEGIHSFNPLIQGSIDPAKLINIYIEPMTEIILDNGLKINGRSIRLMRRMIRDMYTRGHSFDSTIRQWVHVLESEVVNIYPFTYMADYTVDSFAEYELRIYRQLLYPMLDDTAIEQAGIMKALEGLEPLSPECVPEKSLIREFTIF